jgi:DNA (cytosine-5)-methyltransferase 1
VKYVLGHGTRRDKIKVLGNGVCAPVMRAVVGSLLGASSRDVLPDDVPAASRYFGKKVPGQAGTERTLSY